jgi:hypothetical protein
LREKLDLGSDHYPIESSFLCSLHVSPQVPKPLWRKADKAALSLRARELDLLPRNHENCEDIDAGVDSLVRWIKEAVAQHIPLSKPVSFSVSWWSSELTQLVRNARRARRWHTRHPCDNALRAYVEALNAKGEAIKTAKAALFKQAVAEAARGRKGIWPIANCTKTSSHPPPTLPSIPSLVTPSGDATTPLKKQKP